MDLHGRLQATLGESYTLERELGGGGMSRVFVAHDTRLDRKVVVKVLSPELAAGISVERFKREILVAAKLQQANIVPVLSAGEMEGLPYYTMPFVEGLSLRGRLAMAGALPVAETVGVLRDVARALAYAHEHGVVHRDIKPDNVLLSGGTAVVTDFGIAKALAAARHSAGCPPKAGGCTRPDAEAESLTQVGTSLGTPAYMAPEQAAGDPGTDHRADLYALGIVAYEMLAGRAPFHGLTAQRLLAAQLTETPRPVAELRPDCPPALAELVTRCLAKEPERRPESAADVVRVLDAVGAGTGARVPLWKALALWAAAAVAVPLVARAAIIAIGLPDWVFTGALIVMLLGLPVVLFTRRTWQRMALGGAAAVGALVLLIAGYMTVRALGIGPAGSLMARGALGERERLIVADFKSPAADTALGPTVTEAVRADLTESRNLDVVQATAVQEALQRMQRPADARVDFALARELATREGIKAVLDGEILALGGGYVLTAKLIATQTGQVLASFRETAGDARALIPAIGRLGKDVRAKVGESLRSVQETPPLDQVTTTSLEALRKYAAGVRASDVEGNLPKAAALLREAVAIDSTFASAWRKLGVVTNNGAQSQAVSDSAFARAYRYRDRLAFFEKQMTIASYFSGPGNDRQRAEEAFEAIIERDSSDTRVFNNFAFLLRGRREFARAERLYRKSAHGPRPVWQSYMGLLVSQFDQGKLAAAESTLAEWRRVLPGPRALMPELHLVAERAGLDSAWQFLLRAQTDRDPLNRFTAAGNLGTLALIEGRLRETERRYQETRRMSMPPGSPELARDDSMTSILHAVWFLGAREEGARRLDALLARHPVRSWPERQRPYLQVAAIYAWAGRPDRARAVLADWAAEQRDPVTRSRSEPERHRALGEIALAERRPADAIAEFRQADQLRDGPADDCTICLSANLARAYDLAGNADSAIAHFERYLTTPYYNRVVNVALDPLLLAGTHKRLGELYEAKGDRARALAHYAAFTELWKDADPELQSKVAEVRGRIARLREGEGR